MEKMNASIAITTITYYPNWYRGKLRSIKHTDKIRGDLALEFVRKAKEKGYQVVISDGKSARTFRKELRSVDGIHILRRLSAKRSVGRRIVLKKASKLEGVKIIIMSEPEKLSLLDSVEEIVEPLLGNTADIIIPKREEKLFAQTYPDYQYESEQEANDLYNEELRSHNLLGKDDENLDMFFGPRAFKNTSAILSLFMRKYHLQIGKLSLHEFFDVEQYSNTLYFPIELALKKGLRVKSVTVPFRYPELQKRNEIEGTLELFMEKRKAQKVGILIDLIHFISYLDHNPGSRIKRIQ